MTTLALLGSVLDLHGTGLFAGADDLNPTGAAGPNLNLALWSSIAGTLTPFLVAVVNQPRWAPAVRALLTVLVSLGIGAATAAAEGRLTGARWTTATLLVLGAAVAAYATLWKNVAPALEAATSPRDRR